MATITYDNALRKITIDLTARENLLVNRIVNRSPKAIEQCFGAFVENEYNRVKAQDVKSILEKVPSSTDAQLDNIKTTLGI